MKLSSLRSRLFSRDARPSRRSPPRPSASWAGTSSLVAIALLAASACSEDKIALSVDLRTDFLPATEFSSVVTEVVPDGSVVVTSLLAVTTSKDDFVAGARIADFRDLPAGGFSVRVKVRSAQDEVMVERLARLSVAADYSLTMVVTRNCEGIECPLADGDPNLTTCLGGKCVDPSCSPQNPSACPEPECSDARPCVSASTCVESTCVAGTCLSVPDPKQCKDGQICGLTQGCYIPGKDDCKASSPTEVDCDDGVDDDCDGQLDCADSDCNARPCNDGSQCTTGETCQGKVCGGGAATSCDDQNPCTDDTCDPKLGCKSTARTGSCEDGNPCTSGETCQQGKCVAAETTSCDDQNPCTDDTCDPDGGCLHLNNTASCEDNNPCTINDACLDGTCQGGSVNPCSDDNECTSDSCNPATGCQHTSADGPCNDGLFCNGNDSCLDGKCSQHGTPPCKEMCDETKDVCIGCTVDTDCGSGVVVSTTDDYGALPCTNEGSRLTELTSVKCIDNTCVPQPNTVVTTPISRNTDSQTCGATQTPTWSTIPCDLDPGICAITGQKQGTITEFKCLAGTCQPKSTPTSQACVDNSANGKKCKDATVDTDTCQYAGACDENGSKTVTTTTFQCKAGACDSTVDKKSVGCSRNIPNGKDCAGGYCCSGKCVGKGSDAHCGSCGIDCGGQTCKGIGSGHFACTCANSNAQCAGFGYGAGAKCWDPTNISGTQQFCQCQCIGQNCCAGGATCHSASPGLDYCSY